MTSSLSRDQDHFSCGVFIFSLFKLCNFANGTDIGLASRSHLKIFNLYCGAEILKLRVRIAGRRSEQSFLEL